MSVPVTPPPAVPGLPAAGAPGTTPAPSTVPGATPAGPTWWDQFLTAINQLQGTPGFADAMNAWKASQSQIPTAAGGLPNVSQYNAPPQASMGAGPVSFGHPLSLVRPTPPAIVAAHDAAKVAAQQKAAAAWHPHAEALDNLHQLFNTPAS